MSAVDFAQWAVPDLKLTLGDRAYFVRPPSTAAARKLLAAAVRAEVNLGIVPGPVPAPVQEVLDTFGPDDHPALGDVHDQLVADGVDPQTVDRMAYYATFYWARGKQYADWLAIALWAPRDAAQDAAGDGAGGAGPKG